MNQHRIILSAVALFFFSIMLSAQQFHIRLSPPEKEHILDGSFTDVTKTEAMPATVKEAFAKITAEPVSYGVNETDCLTPIRDQ